MLWSQFGSNVGEAKMHIHFPCWNCGKSLKVSQEHSGRKCRCSQCNNVNSIPGEKQLVTDEDVVEPTYMGEEEEIEPATVVTPEERVAIQKQKAINRVTIWGTLLLLFGMVILCYFLFIYDTTISSAFYPGFRVDNDGKMHRQLIACVSSGVTMLIGALLVSISLFKK